MSPATDAANVPYEEEEENNKKKTTAYAGGGWGGGGGHIHSRKPGGRESSLVGPKNLT